MSIRLVLTGASIALLAACAAAPQGEIGSTGSSVPGCGQWFTRLDHTIAGAGVADAQETRVAGYPHLRTNRFTAALARDRQLDDASFARATLPAMRALDRAARAAELGNLPDGAIKDLGTTRAQALQRSEDCAARLLAEAPPARSVISVPDDYRDAQRVLGGYVLLRHPFSAGVQRQLAEVAAAFARPLAPPAGGKVMRYAAVGQGGANTARETALLDRHSPVFEKEVTHADDLPGALAWDAALAKPVVQPDQPAVYRHISFTRYRGRTLTQLVYTIWFGGRPSSGPGDLLSGHLDGLVWRVTLDVYGNALVYDTMHPCGCYHYFIPTERAVPVPAPADEPEWAFVPQSLRQPQVDGRVVLRIATRTHQLERATVEPHAVAARGAIALRTLPQDDLRALPVRPRDTDRAGSSATHSAYDADGLVPGSERAERFVFWSMGIVSAGQMRQWGRHATAFVGRRHFDDADLFEKRFVFDLRE